MKKKCYVIIGPYSYYAIKYKLGANGDEVCEYIIFKTKAGAENYLKKLVKYERKNYRYVKGIIATGKTIKRGIK